MSTRQSWVNVACVAACCLAVALSAWQFSAAQQPKALADAAQPAAGRYQVVTAGAAMYLVDTTTGQVWHGSPLEKGLWEWKNAIPPVPPAKK